MTKQAKRERAGEAEGRRRGIIRDRSPRAERHLSAAGVAPEPLHVTDPWRALAVVARWIGLPPHAWPAVAHDLHLGLSEHPSPDVTRALHRLWVTTRIVVRA